MKRRRVSKDKKTKIPKKYLSGLKGGKRSARASLIKAMSEEYKKFRSIPRTMFTGRYKSFLLSSNLSLLELSHPSPPTQRTEKTLH